RHENPLQGNGEIFAETRSAENLPGTRLDPASSNCLRTNPRTIQRARTARYIRARSREANKDKPGALVKVLEYRTPTKIHSHLARKEARAGVDPRRRSTGAFAPLCPVWTCTRRFSSNRPDSEGTIPCAA